MMTGPKPQSAQGTPDLSGREALVVAPLIAAIVGLGVFPKVVLDVVNPAVEQTMSVVGVSDPPARTAPDAEGSSR
jgi:NADH-quinone oxidoreductase subunit M